MSTAVLRLGVATLLLSAAGWTAAVSVQTRSWTVVGTLPVQADTVELQNGLAYVASGKTFTVFDVANPATPRRLGSHTFPDPAKPITLPRYKTPGLAQRVALQGRLAYVADGAGGLTVVDLSTPRQPVTLGSHPTASAARDVAVADSLVLVAVANADAILLREIRK